MVMKSTTGRRKSKVSDGGGDHPPSADFKNKLEKGIGRSVCVLVREGAAGPFDAVLAATGPDSEERAAMWEGEPKGACDEAWRGRMYDVNKELADHLAQSGRIEVGRLKARTAFKLLF